MDRKLVIRCIGGLLVAMMALTYWTGVKFRPEPPEEYMRGFRSPILALELATDPKQASGILKEPGNQEKVRTSLFWDHFLIVAYTLFFLFMAFMFWRWGLPWAKPLFFLAVVFAFAMAMFDVIENDAISCLLDTVPSDTDIPIQTMKGLRQATLSKWASFFLVLLILSLGFLSRMDWVAGIGVVLGASAALGMGGVIYDHHAIEFAFIPLPLAFLPLALLFLVWPEKFLKYL